MNQRSLGALRGPLRDPRCNPIQNLSKYPFLGSAALSSGLVTSYELRRSYRAVYRNVYLANDIELTARLRAEAAWMFSGPDAVLTGLSAAAVHGTRWLDPGASAEIIRNDRRAPTGLKVHTYSLGPEDVWIGDGMRLTTAARTAFDIGRLLPCEEAVPIIDALLNQTQLDRDEVWALAAANCGIRGYWRFRRAFAAADGGAQSPLESRVRMLANTTCEWPVETQIPFHDQWSLVFTRVAMGWSRLKLAIECDQRRAGDIDYRTWMLEHTATLESLGWRVVWVTTPMMTRPGHVFQRIQKEVLAARRRLRC
jgi:hypothetical protein